MSAAPDGNRERSPTPITVWSHVVDGGEDVDQGWVQMLDASERSMAARLPTRPHRNRFIARRAMLREVLAASVRRDPAALRFRTGEFGKPALLQDGSERVPGFNMSHSGALVVLAVSRRGEVGIDVEALRALTEQVSGLFSRREQRQLEALPPSEAPRAFYRYWTAKEAVLKLMGTGFSLPPDAVEITDPQEPLGAISINGDRARASAIGLTSLAQIDGFTGAVATWSSPVAIEHRRWPEDCPAQPSGQPRID